MHKNSPSKQQYMQIYAEICRDMQRYAYIQICRYMQRHTDMHIYRYADICRDIQICIYADMQIYADVCILLNGHWGQTRFNYTAYIKISQREMKDMKRHKYKITGEI